MQLSCNLSHRLEMRLDEPSGFNGPRSPFIRGHPIEKYTEVAPVKIGLFDPQNVSYTDAPSCFESVFDVQKLWEDSLIESVYHHEWKMPLVCPPVVDADNCLADGNHRSCAAGIHSPKMYGILIENNKDIKNVRKLAKAGLLFWPHGNISYKELMAKKESMAKDDYHSDFLYSLNDLDDPYFREYEQSIYFKPRPKTKKFLEYCVAKSIHQYRPYAIGKSVFTPDESIDTWGEIPIVDADNQLLSNIKKIALRNPLIRERILYDVNDVVSDVLFQMKNYLKNDKEKK
ncbi:MAG: hypothetical protein AABX16_01055 [Nanoarchaeota archaeon]